MLSKRFYILDFLISWFKTRLPEVNRTGGNSSPSYAFSLFLRLTHLFLAHSGRSNLDDVNIAELGPGDSKSLGYLFLHFGANTWTGFDAYPYAKNESIASYHDLMRYISSLDLADLSLSVPPI